MARACALGWLVVLTGCGDEGGTAEERERVERGLEVAPVPLNLEGRDRELVGLGSYIVNAQAACADCHSSPQYAPGGDPFQGQPERISETGYLSGGEVFGMVAPSLRPDAQGRPAGESLEEFLQIIRTGRDDGRILQVMPWPVYQEMNERDLRAVYEYLSALPPQP